MFPCAPRGAGNGNVGSALQDLSGVARADYARKAKLAADDRAVTSTATTVGDDCRSLFMIVPGWVGHGSHEYVSALNSLVVGSFSNAPAVTDLFSYGDTGDEWVAMISGKS